MFYPCRGDHQRQVLDCRSAVTKSYWEKGLTLCEILLLLMAVLTRVLEKYLHSGGQIGGC
jgi:hypothetical protein